MDLSNPGIRYTGQSEISQGISQLASQQATSVPPIHNAVERQVTATAQLHEEISSLEQRLTMILAQRPPEPITDGKMPQPTSLAMILESHTGIIFAACRRLRSIVERLEL